MTLTQGFRRSRAFWSLSGNPVSSDQSHWVPASAGTTTRDCELLGSNA